MDTHKASVILVPRFLDCTWTVWLTLDHPYFGPSCNQKANSVQPIDSEVLESAFYEALYVLGSWAVDTFPGIPRISRIWTLTRNRHSKSRKSIFYQFRLHTNKFIHRMFGNPYLWPLLRNQYWSSHSITVSPVEI
jgi:hypothetical protein